MIVGEIVLRREVIGFGFALLSDAGGELVGLMEVMGDRPEVVEELAEKVPAAMLAHDLGAEEEIADRVRWRPLEEASARETRCRRGLHRAR